MEAVKEIVRHRSFRVVLEEWAFHLDAGGQPSGFAWWLENVMSESRPLKGYPGLRKRCWAFARALMGQRWETVRQALPDHPAFRLPYAPDFYKAFKSRLISDIRYYVKSVAQPCRPQNLSCQARLAVAHFGGLFPEKGQEKRPKKAGP